MSHPHDLTDDEAIGAVLLLGAAFHRWAYQEPGSSHAWGCWIPDSPDGDHPWFSTAARTKAGAARKCLARNLPKTARGDIPLPNSCSAGGDLPPSVSAGNQ